jgi:hypothetical protein
MNFKIWFESLPDVSDDHFLDAPRDLTQVSSSKLRPQKKQKITSPFVHGEVKPKRKFLGLGFYGSEQA